MSFLEIQKTMDWVKDRADEVMGMFKLHPVWASLATLGTLAVARCTCSFLKGVWKNVFRPGKDLYKTYGGGKAWAVVTGGSSGIGLAYAKRLAKDGFNLLLIAKGKEKLAQAKKEILMGDVLASCEIQTVAFDLAQHYSEETYVPLVEAITGKDIAILVNNAGIDHACEFNEFTLESLSEMINVNISSMTFITRLVVLGMMGRKKRSAIINISSTFTTSYVPYFNVYIATKAYMNALMSCLHRELKDKKIDVLTCITGEVSTPRNPMKSIWHTTPESVAKGHLAALGKDKETAGGIRHALYGPYLRSCFSKGFKKSLGDTARSHTIGSFPKRNLPIISGE